MQQALHVLHADLSLLRPMVREILAHPFQHDWTVQGFGMLRMYFNEDKRWRLNLWNRKFAVAGVSTIHDHPWHFQSMIIAGRFTNRKYAPQPDGVYYNFQTIKTGEGGGPVGEPAQMPLKVLPEANYLPGMTYSQHHTEIHESLYADGTVTLNRRDRVGTGEHARVFWALGQEWVDAEPRKATPDEVYDATEHSLRSWFNAPHA